MDKKRKSEEGQANLSDDVPPISPDREHLLAKTFEDPNLAEILPDGSPSSVVQETVEAVQELVQDAAIELGAPSDADSAIETASFGGSSSMIPESSFAQDENQVNIQVSTEELQLELSERPPKSSEIQTGADTQSFADEKHPDSAPQMDISAIGAGDEMEIQKDICATSEANFNQPVPVMMEGSSEEIGQLAAKWEAAESLFQLIACEKTFDDLVESALTVIVRSVNAQAGSVLEVDHKTQEFFFRSSYGGGDPDQLKAFRIPCNKGIVGHVAESREAVNVRDLEDNEMHLKAISMSVGYETHGCIAAPILIANQLYGVIELFNKQGTGYFDQKDLQSLEDGVKMLAKVLEVRFLMAELARKVA